MFQNNPKAASYVMLIPVARKSPRARTVWRVRVIYVGFAVFVSCLPRTLANPRGDELVSFAASVLSISSPPSDQ